MPTANRLYARVIELEITNGNEQFRFRFADTPRDRCIAKQIARRWAADRTLWFTEADAEQIERLVG